MDTFVNVEFPGIVSQNGISSALKTFGGTESIAQVENQEAKNLNLRFRPEDPYSIPIQSSKHSRPSLLLRLRKTSNASSTSESKIDCTVLGTIGSTYQFTALCDMQFLPMSKDQDGNYVSLEDKIFNNKLDKDLFVSRDKQDLPLFLTPPMFFRFTPADPYSLRADTTDQNQDAASKMTRKLTVNRSPLSHFSYMMLYTEPKIPQGVPEQLILSVVNTEAKSKIFKELKECFMERPIWTKSAIKHRIKCQPNLFKTLLPALAYKISTGTWIGAWIRRGFDPRLDPSAKIYQIIEFRLRAHQHEEWYKRVEHETNKPRMSTAPQKAVPLLSGASTSTSTSNGDSAKSMTFEANKEPHIFRPDVFPLYAISRYHVCDIELPEVQELIHSNDGQEIKCTQADGWCVPTYADQCRAMMKQSLDRLIARLHVAEAEQKS